VKVDQSYEEFIDICIEFERKKGLKLNIRPEEYMRKCGVLFTAHLDSEVLAGLFCIKDDSNMLCHSSASKGPLCEKPKARVVGWANALLIWEAMKYAHDYGIKSFDFGGYRDGDFDDGRMAGVYEFKRGFGGLTTMKYDYLKFNSVVYRIAELAYGKTASLPVWRWLGRHRFERYGGLISWG
jgi:lipid II:glycine glycyltransferase (peptidoglycan interpeptide bridge formation enzyme)